MNETKFTPGPWIWGDDYQGLYGAGPNNQVLYYFCGEGMSLGYNKHMDANAHLIAAAPDLYEALEDLIINDFGSDGWNSRMERIAIRARAALAKARGEA
jgi:hypothetical protein